MDQAIGAQELGRHPAVAHARPWRDYINIDLRSSPVFRFGKPAYKGELTTRIRLLGTRLMIERSSGPTSLEWEDNLRALVTWLRSRDVQIHVQQSAKVLHYLASAERHVAQGQEQIIRQRQLIDRLESQGHSTAQAQDLLHLMEGLQAQRVARRDRLRDEMSRP